MENKAKVKVKQLKNIAALIVAENCVNMDFTMFSDNCPLSIDEQERVLLIIQGIGEKISKNIQRDVALPTTYDIINFVLKTKTQP